MLRAVLAYILYHVFDLLPIQPVVNLKPQAANLLNDAPAQLIALLTDASRKDERVDLPCQRYVVAAHEAAHAVHEQVERQLALWLVRGGDDAEIGRARQRLPAALLVQDLLGAGDVQLLRRGRGQLAHVACVVEHQTVYFV